MMTREFMHNFNGLQVKCFDWDADTSHDLIGQFTTTFAELSTAADGGAQVSHYLIPSNVYINAFLYFMFMFHISFIHVSFAVAELATN